MNKNFKNMFATLLKHAPLFNQNKIETIFLNFDSVYLIREIEMVLLKGSSLTVINENNNVLEVVTNEYFSSTPLYIDKRFVQLTDSPTQNRVAQMPLKKEILATLPSYLNLPYIWGGNISIGILDHLSFYPPKRPLSPFEYSYYILKGVDCSGLLYAVTNGLTKRNTSDIYSYYPEVTSLKPLDLIVWKGHVMIVLSHDKVIESRQYDGVVISNLNERLKEVEKFNPKFVRFY